MNGVRFVVSGIVIIVGTVYCVLAMIHAPSAFTGALAVLATVFDTAFFLAWTAPYVDDYRRWAAAISASGAAVFTTWVILNSYAFFNSQLQQAESKVMFSFAHSAAPQGAWDLWQHGPMACGVQHDLDASSAATALGEAVHLNPLASVIFSLFDPGYSHSDINGCARDYIKAYASAPHDFSTVTAVERAQLLKAADVR